MVYLDLNKALKSNQSKHNLVLHEGDSIVIPKTMDVVHITGELMNLEGNSISAPFFNSKRANYYVKNFAGGFSKSNDRNNTVVVYPNGIAKKSKNFLLFKVSPKVTKGSTIRVTSKNKKSKRKNQNKVDWNQQIENAMLKISAVLTLWVLLIEYRHNRKHMSENKEIEIRDIVLTLKEIKNEIFSKSLKIGFFVFIFSFLAVVFNYLQDSKYKAELSFVVEDKQQSSPLSSMSGLASQFGFDLFSSSNTTFSRSNIMELLKSRGVISKTLLRPCNISGKKGLFIDHFISIYDLDSDWEDDIELNKINFNGQLNIKHDSIVTLIWNKIIEDHISVEIRNDETDIIYLSFISSNERFSKQFSENLIDEMSKMYVEYQTKQSTNTIDFLQNRSDSVFNELQSAEEDYARVKDINQRIIKASGRLKELQLMRNVEVLNTMYLELVKNIEVSKLTLLNQTPIIQVIDKPILPLEDKKLSPVIIFILAFVLSKTIAIFYFVFRKLVIDSLN